MNAKVKIWSVIKESDERARCKLNRERERLQMRAESRGGITAMGHRRYLYGCWYGRQGEEGDCNGH